MNTLLLTESKAQIVSLAPGQAKQLTTIGRVLASDRSWWGDDDDADRSNRSVVQCQPMSATKYKVVVTDAIGAIGLGDTQLVIQPKIPLNHLVYLLDQAGRLPRGSSERAQIHRDEAFVDLIVRWFVSASEHLLRLGLDRDYEHTIDNLSYAKGRIHALPTLRSILAGRPVIRCEFDTFSLDTSLNRVLRAAVLHVLSIPDLQNDLRRRARSVCQRLDGAGPLRGHDQRVLPDARTRHYRDAHQLALMILSCSGIGLGEGMSSVWTFLYRTPESVEEGVRASLRRHLGPAWEVAKKGKRLVGSKNRLLQPDLVFGAESAVGDIKYRRTIDGEISRSHLNQITTFATGYRAKKAVVIAFGDLPTGEFVHVGEVQVTGMNWVTSEADPEQAGAKLAVRVRTWLAS
jgi:5-methylcytosine-specific restriction endonuclease McrBC regulatory subunit McrC